MNPLKQGHAPYVTQVNPLIVECLCGARWGKGGPSDSALNPCPVQENTAQYIAYNIYPGGDGSDRNHSPNPQNHHGRNRTPSLPAATPNLPTCVLTGRGWKVNRAEEFGASGADAHGNWHTWRRDIVIITSPTGERFEFGR